MAPESPNYSVLDTTFVGGGRATTWLDDAIVEAGVPQAPDAVTPQLELGHRYTIRIDFAEPPQGSSDGRPVIVDDGVAG